MKGFLTALLTLFTLSLSAQFNYPTATPTWFYRARVASPDFDTTGNSAITFPGLLQFRQAAGDTGYYFSTGRKYIKVGSGSGDLSAYWDSTAVKARFVPLTRSILTSSPLIGGSDLSGDITLGITAADGTTTDGYVTTGDQDFGGIKNFLTRPRRAGFGIYDQGNDPPGSVFNITTTGPEVVSEITTNTNGRVTWVDKRTLAASDLAAWDSATTKTRLSTQGQVTLNVNNLSYVPGYTNTTNKAAGNTSLTNQYGLSSGIGGFYTNIVGSTDYPDTAGTGMIIQRASTATSVSSRGSMQLWTSASKGQDSSLFFRKTDVNAATGNVWLPWRKIVDDFNFKKIATASGFWDTTATKQKLSKFAPSFLRVKKLNDTVYVRSIYNDSTDMVQLMVLHNANNQAALLGTYLIKATDSTLYYRVSSTLINSGTDNTAPLQYVYLGSISGAHGVQAITATITAHGKTSADIGSVWSDGTYQYYLAEITDANNIVFMSRPYTTAGEQGIRQNAFAASTLTHVSGATHTGSMVSTNEDPLQRYPVIFNNFQKLIVDDRVITADSEYYCNSFQIVDRYDVVDPTTYTATNPFVWNSGSSLARVDMAYQWGRNGAIVMNYGIKFNTSHKTVNSGLIQVQKLPIGGTFAKLFDYIPGTKSKTVGATTYNFASKQDMTSNPAANFYLVKTDMIDSAKPANRMVQLLTNSSNVALSNSAHGYDISYGSGLPDNRRVNNDTAIWYITTANKSYPRLQSGINSLGKNIYASAYLTFFDPKKNDSLTACYAIPSANAWLLYIDAHQQLTRYTVKVDQFLTGKRIEIIEKNDSMTLVTSDVVPAGGLIINNTNSNGYLVLRLTDFDQPAASATAAGKVITTAQTFAGPKTFQDSVIAPIFKMQVASGIYATLEQLGSGPGAVPAFIAPGAFAIRSNGVTSLTANGGLVTINGVTSTLGLKTNIRTITTNVDVTLTSSDYTVVLQNGTPGSSQNIILPDPTISAGAMYVLIENSSDTWTLNYSVINPGGSALTTLPINTTTILQSSGTDWYRVK